MYRVENCDGFNVSYSRVYRVCRWFEGLWQSLYMPVVGGGLKIQGGCIVHYYTHSDVGGAYITLTTHPSSSSKVDL